MVLYYNLETAVVYAARRWPKRRYAAHDCSSCTVVQRSKLLLNSSVHATCLFYIPSSGNNRHDVKQKVW